MQDLTIKIMIKNMNYTKEEIKVLKKYYPVYGKKTLSFLELNIHNYPAIMYNITQ